MGSCVSSAKNISEKSDFRNNKLSKVPSTKNNNSTIADVALKSHFSSFRDSGSKDDCFFDSKPWMESDCDDDFFSVNGDVTPSLNNTPIHPRVQKDHIRVDKSPSDENASSPVPGSSPMESKKKLVELFRDSMRDNENGLDDHVPNQKETTLTPPLKSTNDSLDDSGTNSVSTAERPVDVDSLNEMKKPSKSIHSCLPGFVSCRSASQSKKMDTAEVVDNAPAAV